MGKTPSKELNEGLNAVNNVSEAFVKGPKHQILDPLLKGKR